MVQTDRQTGLTPIPGSPGDPGLPASPVSPCDVTVICELICEKFIITLTIKMSIFIG